MTKRVLLIVMALAYSAVTFADNAGGTGEVTSTFSIFDWLLNLFS